MLEYCGANAARRHAKHRHRPPPPAAPSIDTGGGTPARCAVAVARGGDGPPPSPLTLDHSAGLAAAAHTWRAATRRSAGATLRSCFGDRRRHQRRHAHLNAAGARAWRRRATRRPSSHRSPGRCIFEHAHAERHGRSPPQHDPLVQQRLRTGRICPSTAAAVGVGDGARGPDTRNPRHGLTPDQNRRRAEADHAGAGGAENSPYARACVDDPPNGLHPPGRRARGPSPSWLARPRPWCSTRGLCVAASKPNGRRGLRASARHPTSRRTRRRSRPGSQPSTPTVFQARRTSAPKPPRARRRRGVVPFFFAACAAARQPTRYF